MANIKKYSSMKDIGHICKHHERSVESGHYSNSEIDESRICNNYNLAPERGKQTDYIKQKINSVMDGRMLRKDAVRMCCCVVNTPQNLPEDKHEIFFVAVYDFLVARYGGKSGMGEDIVVSAYVHEDESEGHLNFCFLPVINKNGIKTFCAKEAVGRKDLQTLHDDLGKYLEDLGICKKTDIKNGKTQRDSSGRALSVRELKKRSRERERERSNRWERTTDRDRTERTIGRW